MSAAEKSTVTSRLKGKNAEPYIPEESLRFEGRKRTFDKTEEYPVYSKIKPTTDTNVRPRKPRQPSSSKRGLRNKTLPQRMTKAGPADSPNNPFALELAPEKVGESSSAKFVLKPAQFTPLPEKPESESESEPEPIPEPEHKSDSVEMASESRKGMPNRRDNKAPYYDRNRPEELLRYVEDVEKEMHRAGIREDQQMKDWLRHYADQRSSDEWTVLETYPEDEGSYADFVKELVSHYPEATDSLEGSIARLDKLCAKSTPLTTKNLSIILEFIRGFKFEGRKLLHGGCISNREIVSKFLNCLDPELKKTVVWQVSQTSLNATGSSDGQIKKARHHTDPIEFETLLRVSENLVRSVDSYNTITVTSPPSMSTGTTNRTQHTVLQRPIETATPSSTGNRMVQLLEDLNESMAKNTDVLVNMAKENTQRHGETTKSIETVHTLLNTWHKDGDRLERPGSQTYPSSSNRSAGRRDQCHYCWGPGHYIAHCEFLATDVAEGKVQTQDNGTRIDFKTVPKEPSNLSPKDRINQQWKNRKQFFIEDLPEDGIIDLVPNGLVTLQANQKIHDKRDELIADLQEKNRRANEERDMWKAVTRQSNTSVMATPHVSQTAPQPSVSPAQATELATMLSKMLNLSTANQENIEKGFPKAQ